MSRTRLTPYHFETMRTARLVLACAVFFVVVTPVVAWAMLDTGALGVLLVVVLVFVTVMLTAVGVSSFLPDAGLRYEWCLRRQFRQVCQQKHLVYVGSDKRVTFPKYDRLIGTDDAFRLRVRPLVGQSLADWDKASAAFSLAYGSRTVRFEDDGTGGIVMKVGTHRLQPRLLDEVDRVAHDGDQPWREQLKYVVIGESEHGKPYLLPLIDSHVLIAGQTGAGKGSVVWSVLVRLVPAMKAGVVRFWGFDPKRMELSMGRSFFGGNYAATPDDMVAMLERAHDEMQERADSLSGRARKFEPSTATPLNVLVIDELGYLSSLLQDRKLQARVERALSGILVLGRAVGYVVIGALQDPRKSTLDFRDLFPTRVAMRLPKAMVDLVLGTGMYEAGAHCDLIPAGAAGAGVAYVLSEMSTVPECIRASWCSDELITQVAGTLPPPNDPPLIAV